MSQSPTTGTETTRPITVLIAALGGEGGGVLTDWIVTAARASDLVIQSTSIPGVAQRTGATTYYVEVWPEPRSALGDRKPVMSLSPAPGEVDLFVSSELMETARAILNGFVTPDRTRLIASTSRVLTTKEKMAMGDGEFDPDALRKAVAERSKDHKLVDMAVMAAAAGAPVSAVMLGVVAGAGTLPIPRAAFEDAIRAEGKAVAANLKGFDSGFAAVSGEGAETEAPAKAAKRKAATSPAAALAGRVEAYPAAVRDLVSLGVARQTDYQDARYAALYLDRLDRFRDMDEGLLAAVARHLAVRMSYEDIIRVAALKTRPERFARIRGETQADPGDLVRVTEFFKPGVAEVCDILPAGMARRRLAKAERNGRLDDQSWPMELEFDHRLGLPQAALPRQPAPHPPPHLPLRRRTGGDRAVARRRRPGGGARHRAGAGDRRVRPADQGLRQHPPARQRQHGPHPRGADRARALG